MNLKYDDFGRLEKLDVYMVSQDRKSKVPIQIHNIKIEMRDLEISKVTFDVDEEESIIRDLYTWEKYEGTTWEELAGLTWLDITRSEDYTLFESLRIIYIPALGDKAYFQLSTPSETQENKRNYKSCTAYSLEYQLTQKDVSYFIINMGTIGSRDGIVLYDKINPDKSLLDLALKNAPNWSVGEVDTSIALKSRSFEIDKSDIYSFLVDDVADAYKCVFLFDTVNCKVNVVALENYGKDTDIHISSKNLAKRIAIESAEDSIFTRFYVEGKDGLDIRDVNLGSDYIEDYSYYNSPEWLGSQELCDKYNDYIGLREMQRVLYINKQKENIEKLNQYHELMNRVPDNFDSMIWAEYGLIELRAMRDTYQNVVDSQIENGHNSPSHINHDAYLINKKALDDIKAELIVRENEVDMVQLALDNIAIELKQIIDAADKNTYFTKDELMIFSSLEVNTDYSDESYVVTDSMSDEMVMQIKEDLYTSAVKEIYKSSHPQYSFKTELLNLFNIPEFKPIKSGFDLGSFVTLSMRDNYHIRLRLIAIDIDFNDLDSLTVEFSNMTRSRDGLDDYMALVKNAINRTSASITRSLNTSMIGVHEELNTIESTVKKGVSYEYLFANYASIGTLEAVNAKIYNIETTYLTADEANILFLTAEQADIKYGNVEELTANVADIKTLLAGNITADNIKVGTITAESAIIADAAITRANIEVGAINSALIEEGAIGTVQIADGSITDAKIVELTANKITAGTLSVERLIIRDTVNPDQSLIYQINNIDGALQSVRGDTLNGEILTERSITADRIVAEAITANEIAANAITTNKILANAITADKILADSILARHIKAGEITVDHVNSEFGATLDLSSNTAIRSQVSKDNIISTINQSPEEISIEANKVTIGTGTNFERGETYTWEKYAGKTWVEISTMSSGGTWLEASRSPEYSPALISRTLEKISASLGSMEYSEERAFYGETIIVGGFLNTNLIMANSIVANKLKVDSLSAITGNIGTVTAGLITSADGSSYFDLSNNKIKTSNAEITGGSINITTSDDYRSVIKLSSPNVYSITAPGQFMVRNSEGLFSDIEGHGAYFGSYSGGLRTNNVIINCSSGLIQTNYQIRAKGSIFTEGSIFTDYQIQAKGSIVTDKQIQAKASIFTDAGIQAKDTIRAARLAAGDSIYTGYMLSISGGNAYISGSLSAETIIDRTPYYDGNALEELSRVKGDGNGGIDHSTLPKFAQIRINQEVDKPKSGTSEAMGTVVNETLGEKRVVNTQGVLDNSNATSMELQREEKTKEVQQGVSFQKSIDGIDDIQNNQDIQETVVKEVEGRDIGAMVSVLTKAIQQLISKNEEQDALIEDQSSQIKQLQEGILK